MSFPHNNEGRKVITDIYDYETCKEIVNNGCVSGVCSQHIYYADVVTEMEKIEYEQNALIESYMQPVHA